MYKDIVVCVNEAQGRDNTIRAAAQLANASNANLTGLYIRGADTPPSSVLSDFVSDALINEAKHREDERVYKAKDSFYEITGSIGCDNAWVEAFERNHPLRVLAYADLVITDQAAYDPRQGVSNVGFISNLILDSGKPVILIPKNWEANSLGSDVVIGWDESREAVRAVQDAMPLLQTADHVEVVSINHKKDDSTVDISEISTYLTRRNIVNSFKLAATNDEHNTPEKVLINRAKIRSANLIVVGGYGHTRLREIVLGGVTRYLTKNSNVPVLFSH